VVEAYRLALGGVDELAHVLRLVFAEADLLMAVDGYPELAALTADALRGVA
jgi:lactate 2-monooxygenase